MFIPSITTIFGGIFFAYIVHSMWNLAQLFTSLQCLHKPCYAYFLNENPSLQLAVFSSESAHPTARNVKLVMREENFNYRTPFDREVEVSIPTSTRRNGTMHLHVILALASKLQLDWNTLRRDGPTVIYTMRISEYMEKRAEKYTLLGEYANDEEKIGTNKNNQKNQPKTIVTHLPTDVFVTILTDHFSMSNTDVPSELVPLIRVTQQNKVLPIVRSDYFNARLQHLMPIDSDTKSLKFQIHYAPISTGRLRLMILIEQAMGMVTQLGFSKRDLDEVKVMFSGANLYLLLCTVFAISVHLLFDFLSFKNDVIFWRNRKSYAGLSIRTALWRAFSQGIIFLYLLDEYTSLLVILPAGIGALIELWKCRRLFTLKKQPIAQGSEEQRTNQFDKQGMKYLSYALYPLCICLAIYSLIYTPQTSWYSWTLKSLVNGVYAFGFLFMLPQLFINYKLKSVAALPWRAFMYKAFNTFIDDFFAFIIAMPTMHRVACLRDDVVFLIYLYQRWLYPVDKNRIDRGVAFAEEVDPLATEQPNKSIKNTKKD